MREQVRYFHKMIKCGKQRCKKCRERGEGHGPYWYATHVDSEGNATSIYLGPQQKAMIYLLGQLDQSLLQDDLSEATLLLDQLLVVDPGNRTILQRFLAMLISRIKQAPNSLPFKRRHQSSLIGRDQEQSRLLALLRHPTPYSIAFLTGGAGLGKTRLAEETASEAIAQGWNVVWGRAYTQERRFSYALWSEVLYQVFPKQMIESYRDLVRRCPSIFEPLGILLPYLQEYFDRQSTISEREQFTLWQTIGDVFVLLSQQAPLLVVLDDLQWADISSLELLAYLARKLQGTTISFLCTYRENELDANHPLHTLLVELQHEQMSDSIGLAPLLDEHMNLLLSRLQVPAPLMYDIRSRAAGNPFFAEELAHVLEKRKSTSDQNSQTELSELLPNTISAVLDLRLSQLSQSCQHLLRNASIIGGSFEFSLISALEGSSLNEDSLHDQLEEAMRAGILVEQGNIPVTYTFWHPLIVTHLYQQLSAARRMGLHLRVAGIFQRLYRNREHEMAAALARHLVLGGGDAHQIAFYAELAGRRAHALFAYPDAISFYRLAIEHLELQRDPQSHEHLNWLQFCLARCLRITGSPLEARTLYESVLATTPQEREEETQEDAQLIALLCCELGLSWYDTGDLAQAQVCYKRGEERLQKAQVEGGLAWARLRYEQSYASWRVGKYEDALHLAERALALFQEDLLSDHPSATDTDLSSFRPLIQPDPVDLGRTHQLIGLITNGAGQPTEALIHLNEALVVFEEHRCLRESAIVCCNLGDLYMRRAEYDHAQVVLERCLRSAEQIGDLPLAAFALGNLGILNIHCGNLDKAEIFCQRAIETAEYMKDTGATSLWTTYLAIALTEQRRLSEAHATLVLALQQAHVTRLPSSTGITLSAITRLRLAQAQIFERSNDANQRFRFLSRAKHAILHTLEQQGIEEETKIEAHLFLAQISYLGGDLSAAYLQVSSTLSEAQQIEGKGLIARASCLRGCIFASQGQESQAEHAFEQAIQICEQIGMRLEHARALFAYGQFLIGRKGKYQKQGLSCLQKVQQLLPLCTNVQDDRFFADFSVDPPLLSSHP